VLIEKKDKKLLGKLKEEHCTSAPLLIFVGMDKRVYGSLSNKDYETALFVESGAAVMAMITGAQESGLGTCWNHFGRDLIESRKINQETYHQFCKALDIEEYIELVAILAVCIPKYIPSTPARMDIKDLIIWLKKFSRNIKRFKYSFYGSFIFESLRLKTLLNGKPYQVLLCLFCPYYRLPF
jgi:hypothetical protein